MLKQNSFESVSLFLQYLCVCCTVFFWFSFWNIYSHTLHNAITPTGIVSCCFTPRPYWSRVPQYLAADCFLDPTVHLGMKNAAARLILFHNAKILAVLLEKANQSFRKQDYAVKSVAFSFFFSKHNIMQGQCICSWFCYLAIFLLFISEAWLKLVIYLLLFSPVLLWRKHPINRGFGGVRYHIGASRLSCHRSACVAVCEGFRPAALKHLSKLNTVHRIKNTCNQEKEVQRMLRRRREEKLRPIGVCFTTMTWRRIHCIYIYCLNSNAL